jgi:hypothetical protein
MRLALQCAREFDHLGYGTFGANLAKGLQDIGVDTWLPEYGKYGAEVPDDHQTVVWASLPGHARGGWVGQRTVSYTMWETLRLPEGMRAFLHNFEQVVVPNDSNVELFGQYHPNVAKVPLGYDAEVWTYQPPPEPADTFRFLFCGAGAAEKSRKGSDVAIVAFAKAFPDWQTMDPSPRLVVKCLRDGPRPAGFIELHAGRWPIGQVVDLYRTCHAMVLPSRGEGWGYHPQQAVACGLPAIVSEIPGHMEYATAPGFATVPVSTSEAAPFIQGDAGRWWEPDVDTTVDALRDVYRNYERWLDAAEVGGDVMRSRFTHRHMAQALVDTIGHDHLTGAGFGSWRKFTERLYPVEVTRNLSKYDCNVGDNSYELHVGARYWLPAHVRQVLSDAGYLANRDENHAGLLPEEVAA